MSRTVTLQPWHSGDFALLERLMGNPRMTEHLGGPETPAQLRERQVRYKRLAGGDRMLKTLGFELLGASDFAYPKGHFMTCNDWRLDLRA